MIEPEIHHDEDLLRIASFDRVLIIRFVGAPSVAHLRLVRDEQSSLVDRVGGKVAMFSVITPHGSIKFDDEARRLSNELLDEMKKNILVGTQVVLKAGFFGSIVRSVMMGVNMVSKPPYPTKVCPSLGEAADFVAEHLAQNGHTLMPDELAGAVETAMVGVKQY